MRPIKGLWTERKYPTRHYVILAIVASVLIFCCFGVSFGVIFNKREPTFHIAPVATIPAMSPSVSVIPPPSMAPSLSPLAPATDPRYSSCAEAKRHGYGPYYRGRGVEYGWYQDSDNDGVVCE